MKLATPDAEEFGQALGLLVDLVFGEPYQQALLSLRLQAFLEELRPIDLTEAQQRIVSAVNLRVEALVAHSFQGLSQWQTALRSIANQLEDLELRARRGRSGQDGLSEALARELGLVDGDGDGDGDGEGEAGDD